MSNNTYEFAGFYASGFEQGRRGHPWEEVLEDRSPEEIASKVFWRGYRNGVASGIKDGLIAPEGDECTF